MIKNKWKRNFQDYSRKMSFAYKKIDVNYIKLNLNYSGKTICKTLARLPLLLNLVNLARYI